MARRKSIPSYCHHKPSGQAVVYIDRKPVYLGVHDTPESLKAYSDLLARLAAQAIAVTPNVVKSPSAVTVGELCLKFVTDEMKRFASSEQACHRIAIRVLRQLFGDTPVIEFGPLRLRVVRDAMVA